MTKNSKKRVLVAMSGGVDSSVAAALLKKEGYEVVGVFMRFWSESGKMPNKCCSNAAAMSARQVANKLDIPFYILDFQDYFKRCVVDSFLDEYAKGRTPNPCVICNEKIKIGMLRRKADELGIKYLATGHYAQLKNNLICEAKDKNKDQAYFLWRLSKGTLPRLLFPLGKMKKPKVRRLARGLDLEIADRPDSQEICFVGDREHYGFLAKHLKGRFRPGDIVDEDGKKLGQHRGLPFYTIGQRKDLDIFGGPYYVTKIDLAKNQLLVTKDERSEKLFADSFFIAGQNFHRDISFPWKGFVKIRYRHAKTRCRLFQKSDGLFVKLAKPERAVTPGQSAVFFSGKKMIGGGVIRQIFLPKKAIIQ